MVNLYIGGLHLGHSDVINFDKRPFADTFTEWMVTIENIGTYAGI